jgi:translation initiation factor 2 alpha subunit (eIF-2alpha)
LRSDSEVGVEDIKSILDVTAQIHYLGGSKFTITVSGADFKDANVKMQNILEKIEKKAREKKAFFEIEKDK